MDSCHKSKIAAEVAECLRQCRESSSPWTTASKFIEGLKQSVDWSDAEIIELQTCVIRALLNEPNK